MTTHSPQQVRRSMRLQKMMNPLTVRPSIEPTTQSSSTASDESSTSDESEGWFDTDTSWKSSQDMITDESRYYDSVDSAHPSDGDSTSSSKIDEHDNPYLIPQPGFPRLHVPTASRLEASQKAETAVTTQIRAANSQGNVVTAGKPLTSKRLQLLNVEVISKRAKVNAMMVLLRNQYQEMGDQIATLGQQLIGLEDAVELERHMKEQDERTRLLKQDLKHQKNAISQQKRKNYELLGEIDSLRVELKEAQEEVEQERKSRNKECEQRLESEGKLSKYIEAQKKMAAQFS